MMRGIEALGAYLIGLSTFVVGCSRDSSTNTGATGGAQAGGMSSSSGTGGTAGGTTSTGGSAVASGGIDGTGGSGPSSGGSTGGASSGGTSAAPIGGAGPFGGNQGSGTITGGMASGGMQATGGTRTGAGGASTGGTGGVANTGGATAGDTQAAGAGGTLAGTTTGGAPTGGAATGGVAAGGTGSGGGSNCPTSADFVGSTAWLGSIEVTSTAEYCGTARESRTLEQELAAKAKLRIAVGTYPLPDSAGSYPFAWPVCFEFPPGKQAPKFAGAGQMTLNRSTHAPTEYYTYRQSQPLSAESGSMIFYGDLSNTSTVGVRPVPLVLDGSPPEVLGSRQYSFGTCSAADCTGDWKELQFYSCNSPQDRLRRDTIVFSGGTVTFEVRIGQAMVSTEPSSFVYAGGTLDGTAFEQRSYWKLVYRPTHHHFTRDYAVLFDSPIGGACGLKAVSVPEAQTTVHTINCDLSDIQARTVSSVTTGQ